MKNILFFAFGLLITISVSAQDPIFTPSMLITSYGIVDSPFGEEVDNIIDGDINTKFLDFELDDGMGFTVDLGGLSYVATSIEITTANDFEERDPVRYVVFGSNDGSTYINIADGIIDCISDRLFSRTYDFVNDISYMYYRVDYTLACDPTGGDGIPSMQVAETQLYGTILGINNNIISDLKLYPNPVNDVLYIESNTEQVNARVYTFHGQLLKEFESSTLNISQLKSGIYFIEISIEGETITRKIIKE